MDAVTTAGLRLGSAAVGPLIKRLFRAEGPGAGLIDDQRQQRCPDRVPALVVVRQQQFVHIFTDAPQQGPIQPVRSMSTGKLTTTAPRYTLAGTADA
ncbi:hypothetical protein AN219_10755 [Streptomyces nanshensis]|nr:hypothetical protein AN219_10755 [Streptomyces nanshensis]